MPTDVSRVDDLRRLEVTVREAFGEVHVLMNNAGIQPGSGIFGLAEAWERVLAVNLWGVIHGSQVFAPGMVGHGEPRADRQHRLQAGDHHPAGRSGLQRGEGGGEGVHRGAAARAAQHRGLPGHGAPPDPGASSTPG